MHQCHSKKTASALCAPLRSCNVILTRLAAICGRGSIVISLHCSHSRPAIQKIELRVLSCLVSRRGGKKARRSCDWIVSPHPSHPGSKLICAQACLKSSLFEPEVSLLFSLFVLGLRQLASRCLSSQSCGRSHPAVGTEVNRLQHDG